MLTLFYIHLIQIPRQLHEVQVSLYSWQLLQLVLLSSSFTFPFFTLHICLFQPLIFKLLIILPSLWLRPCNTFYWFFTIINISVIRKRHFQASSFFLLSFRYFRYQGIHFQTFTKRVSNANC